MKSSEDLSGKRMVNNDFFLLLERKKDVMFYYSPFSFLREVDPVILCTETFIDPLKKEINAGKSFVSRLEVEGCSTWVVWRPLVWDSEYFRRKVIKIDLILPDHDNARAIGLAITGFAGREAGNDGYISIVIPCEDLLLIRAMAQTGFHLVETRLNYYFNSFEHVNLPSAMVRKANEGDIPELREVAVRMRNMFDRVHADPAFDHETADAYLGTFIEESVKGFADMVIVPWLEGVKPFGFLAADYPVEVMNTRIARLVLAAVDNSVHKGWLSKLLEGVLFELKQKKTDIVTTITQASNRPAIRTWEKAGFRLGYVTHLYSYSK